MLTEEMSNHITQLQQSATSEAAAELRDLAETTSDKETRKAAKKALYLLSQKGIQPPPKERPLATVASASEPDEPITAYATTFDGSGSFMVFLVLPEPGLRKSTLITLILSDLEGVRNGFSNRLLPSEIQPRLDAFLNPAEEGLITAQVDPDYARWLIAYAREVGRQVGRMSPPGFLELMTRIGEPKETYETAPIYDHFSPEDIYADETISHDPMEFFKHKCFEHWSLDDEASRNWALYYLSSIHEMEQLGLSDEEKQQRANVIQAEAAESMMDADTREIYRIRLEHCAEVMRLRGMLPMAREALYYALELASDRPSMEVPFASLLQQRSVFFASLELREEAMRSSSSRQQ